MREVLMQIRTWREQRQPVALATNVKKEGSSLRPLGAKMAMTPGLEIAGSVTGGCIESAVYEAAQNVINNESPQLLHYGAQEDGSLWDIGLSCGGSLDVLVETMDSPAWREIYPALETCLLQKELVALATVISTPGMGKKMLVWPDGRTLGSLGTAALDLEVRKWANKQIQAQETAWATLAGTEVFLDVLPPPARMIAIGAVHIAIPLVTLAKALGFYTIVIDPREAFATRERFPHVDELIVEWPSEALERLRPDEGAYIAVLTHDEKLDNPALAVALASPARYVGVLGAQNKIGKRLDALRGLGVTDEQLARLQAPIGIQLGAVSPEEIALSVLAAMVRARHGLGKAHEHNIPALE